MTRNQQAISRALGEAVHNATLRASAERSASATEQVIAAYAAAARGGAGPAESAFDVAVRVYLERFPETDPNAAARIVADIISHRS